MLITDVTLSKIKLYQATGTAAITGRTPWDVSMAEYEDKSFDTSSEITGGDYVRDIAFSTDGTKMYAMSNGEIIYQYTLSTPWDVSTATYDSKSYDLSSFGLPQSYQLMLIFLSSDGTKLYIIEHLSGVCDYIYQYTLSTPWDISTASSAGKSMHCAQDNHNGGLFFKSDGTKLYLAGSDNNSVYQYTLSTPWDISTATYDEKSYDISSENTTPSGLFFSSDGTKMYVGKYGTPGKIYQYTLSIPWDVSTATYDDNFSDDKFYWNFFFKSDGSKLYTIPGGATIIYQFTLDEKCIERGFEYGLTETPTWSEKETGDDLGGGEYSLTLTDLEKDTTYHARSYGKNEEETVYGNWVEFKTKSLLFIGYGEWVKFVTAAPGLPGDRPSGYKNDVCSDNSGFTYILNRSFTDDGSPYMSHFVLSTDLSGKKTLHTNKRLLDIFSYFANKGIGTAKVYIKRNNEATWQEAGEISLTGVEEIIIKHLPIDYLAKHFLIKFVFENDFEFIGMITEAVPIGDRPAQEKKND